MNARCKGSKVMISCEPSSHLGLQKQSKWTTFHSYANAVKYSSISGNEQS